MINQLKSHAAAIASCLLAVVICGRPGIIFMSVMLAPILLLTGIITLLWNIRRPAKLKRLLVNSSIWLCGALILFLLNRHYAWDCRKEADIWLEKIESYHQQHGRYPPNGDVIGLHRSRDHAQPTYAFVDGGPLLEYGDAFCTFDKWFYDFNQHRWDFHPD